MQREEWVTVQREKEYSCNLEGFKGKVNTLVGIKRKVRSLVPSLSIKHLSSSLPVDVGQVWAEPR